MTVLLQKNRLHCEGGFLLSATSYAGKTSFTGLPRVTNLRSVT
jgi:hypothetical protein